MAKSFKTLLAKMSPEAQARVRDRAQQIIAGMPLQELRRARRLSQEELARTLGIAQPQVSKIEGRTDLYVSTLRRYVEALGGSLDVVARFAEGTVRINLFNEIEPIFDSTHAFVTSEAMSHVPPPNLVMSESATFFLSREANALISNMTVSMSGVMVDATGGDEDTQLALAA